MCETFSLSFFFFNDTATTEIYTLSLHDALPILLGRSHPFNTVRAAELQRWIAQGHYERILGGEYTRRGPDAEGRPIDRDIDEARDHYMKEAKAVVEDVVDTAKRAAQAFAEALRKK